MLPKGDKDKEDGLFMDVPTKHVRSITTQRERSQEGLVVWCLPQLDKEKLWKVLAKTPIPQVAYHLESDRNHECMNWLDSWEDGKGCVTDQAA